MNDTFFMKKALIEAQNAYDMGEVPVGAVIVCKDTIIARAHNFTEKMHDVTAHAEIQAITSASSYLDSKYLNDCTIYVTMEPCVMCAGALFWSQIGKIVFGCKDEKRGFTSHTNNLFHNKTEIVSGVMEDECRNIIQMFFQERR